MSREDYDDALYRESINIRITPAPGTGQGPTACWLSSLEPDEADPEGPALTVVTA